VRVQQLVSFRALLEQNSPLGAFGWQQNQIMFWAGVEFTADGWTSDDNGPQANLGVVFRHRS